MTDHRQRMSPTPGRPVYAISVVAELSGAAIQSIRLWEGRGLLTSERSSGGTRRYSADDLTRIARITELVDAGVNIAGIAHRTNRRVEAHDHDGINSSLLPIRCDALAPAYLPAAHSIVRPADYGSCRCVSDNETRPIRGSSGSE
jgi:MerR family transcriptional regulator, heat shock protein HspR